MPAYCVAANCNNSQTTPSIEKHEFLRNRPAVTRKWMKFIQFKRADFLAAPHHAHLCSEHFSECDFANAMEYRMGFASKRNLKRAAFPSMQKGGTFSTITITTAVPVPSLLLLPLRPRLKPPLKSETASSGNSAANTMFEYSFKILPDRLTDTVVSLWVTRAKYQFRLRSLSWPLCSDSPE